MDHTKVIVCPLMSAVTIIDDKKNFRTFRLSTLEAYISQPQFQRVAECLHYVYKKIPELMSPQNWLEGFAHFSLPKPFKVGWYFYLILLSFAQEFVYDQG